MEVCYGVATLLTLCAMDQSCYNWQPRMQLVEVFSFDHASNSVFSIEPVQGSRDVSFRQVDAYGFGSAISANGREKETTSHMYGRSVTCGNRGRRDVYEIEFLKHL